MPLVSFITRTKNRNLLLKRAIKSVFDQTFHDFEMVIVNDGGDKKSLEDEIKNITGINKNNIKLIHNEKSTGMEAASNVGIKASDSKYLLIHDDDDTLDPDFLKEMLPCLEKSENKKGTVCWSNLIHEKIEDSNIEFIRSLNFNNWLQGITISGLLTRNLFPPISFLYKREVLKQIGLYDETLPVLGDWEFNVRFILQYDILLVKKELAYYHQRIGLNSGTFSNSVIGGNESHKEYQILIRNKWLRDDLLKGRIGPGVIAALLNNTTHTNGEDLVAQNPIQNGSLQNGDNEDTSLMLNVQFFWAKDEVSFSEEKSSSQLVELHNSPTQVSFALPEDHDNIHFLRFDLGNKKCLLNIHAIEIKKGNDTVWEWDMNSIFMKNDLLFISNNKYWPEKVVQLSTSRDPFFIIKIKDILRGIAGKCIVTVTITGLDQEQLNTVNLMYFQEHNLNIGFNVF